MSIGYRLRSALAGRLDAPPADIAVARPVSRARAIDLALLRQAALLWVVSRIVLAVFTYFALPFAAQRPLAPPNVTRAFTPHDLLHAWAQWDTGWYMAIALHGYDAHRAAFFPLYPFFVHLIEVVVGPLHIVLAALIVSNLATLAAFVGIAFLTAELFGSSAAGYAAMALAAYPVSFFTATGYSDSLLLAFSAFSLYFALRGQWKAAAACAALATLARPLALALVLPLLWEYGRRYFNPREQLWGFANARIVARAAALAAVVPLTLLCWGLYCW
ncbi:MAG TPA: mannosyltransferase family protein, partial [Chloroflexota bacterium]|nr:mannosyltransferase family protein [Chloroflexota bacterium]